MGLLEGKNVLVTGVRDESSIAFQVARVAQQEGARVVLSSIARAMELTQAAAAQLPQPASVIELDVTNDDDLVALPDRLAAEGFTHLDGLVHSIAFAHRTIMGGSMLEGEWDKVAQCFHTSAYSYKALVAAAKPLMGPGGAMVGLTYDSRFAWPGYNWMGVAKSALEGVNRYLSRDLGPDGIRCNLVSAGSVITPAAMGVPGFDEQMRVLEEKLANGQGAGKASLLWDPRTAEPVARGVVALLSDWFPMTTGDIVYVDGGAHAVNEE
ncbi:MAG: enoyl-ACP reductase FabI [Cellulomonadaceae bacterium]|jgi:enoyl-[acyl-carrier protein] reductase I|nr:enoyl-ACP reductase FabI [Cellulomonadaceae bacterium]